MSGKEIELINKGYNTDLVYRLCSFNESDLEDALEQAINLLTKEVCSVNNPNCIFIGGQPGVGKSVLSDKLKRNSNSVEISMDACRSFHPHYQEIEETIIDFYKDKNLDENVSGHDLALFTQYFAGNMANALIDRISDMKYNIILEWNMRNANDVLNCMNKLNKKGYKNDALVLTIHKDKSYEASQIRADAMEDKGLISRRVNESFHKLCIDTIPSNVDVINSVGKKNNILDNMKVILRNGQVIWDSNINKNLPSQIIEEYYYNEYLSKEFNNSKDYADITLSKELIGLNMNNERKLVA